MLKQSILGPKLDALWASNWNPIGLTHWDLALCEPGHLIGFNLTANQHSMSCALRSWATIIH